jgi:hypothetical protein
MLDIQEAALSELLDLPPGSTILDVGGGHAQLTPFLLTDSSMASYAFASFPTLMTGEAY